MLSEDLYLKFVVEEAHKMNKFFLLDTGEGNGIIDPDTGWYIEELSGWLININDKERAIKSRDNRTAYVDFSDEYVFVKWFKLNDGRIEVKFIKY